MNSIAIIPARMNSSRFPGKPMHKLLGIPMIGHCYLRTRMVKNLNHTYVATCDHEIMNYIESIGGKAIMTSSTHQRATDRTAEALKLIEGQIEQIVDVILMVQGDEPLIPPSTISEVLTHFGDSNIGIVNVMSPFRNRDQFEDKNNVKVVVNRFSEALYFSREPIPSPWKGDLEIPMFNQTGVIAFRRKELNYFNKLPESLLEKIESVDMNRILENGKKIKMVLTKESTIGIDTIEESISAEFLLKMDPIYESYKNIL